MPPKKKTSRKKTTKNAGGRSSSRSVPVNFAARLKTLRKWMKGEGLDGFLVTYPHDIFYLTGFCGEDSWMLVTGRKFVVISDGRFDEELNPVRKFGSVHIRKKSLWGATGGIADDLKLKKIGFQAEHMNLLHHRSLTKAVGARRLKATSDVLIRQRMVKDDGEIKLIRKAIRCQQEALAATIADLRPGKDTECDFAARLIYEMQIRGASGPSFDPIVAGKANGSMPHYRPSGKTKIARNQPLLIDWGARVDGYCSDLTRTFGVGKMPAKVREIYAIVLECQQVAIEAIRPGVKSCDVDKISRAVIEKAGYGKEYSHSLGHGIGLDVHEWPRLSYRTPPSETLEPGMVVTVEPGIYLPGIGGVRLEDDVLVTERGRKVLSDYPKDLESSII